MLSDSCNDALRVVEEAVVEYCDSDYHIEEIRKILRAMDLLNSFIIVQDNSVALSEEALDKITRRAGVVGILQAAQEHRYQKKSVKLVELIKQDNRLNEAFEELYSELTDASAMFENIRDPALLAQVKMLKKIKDS